MQVHTSNVEVMDRMPASESGLHAQFKCCSVSFPLSIVDHVVAPPSVIRVSLTSREVTWSVQGAQGRGNRACTVNIGARPSG